MRKVTAVRAIIRKGDRYLLVQRQKRDKGGGMWQFAGGKTDNQPPLIALRREIREETGLRLSNIKPLMDKYNPKFGHSTRYFTAKARGNVKLQEEELMGFGWFNKKQARNLRLTSGAKAILNG